MIKRSLVILYLLMASPLAGAQISVSAQTEITQLLAVLGSSTCEFNRNGSWHSAPDAKAHLQKKYEYLLKKKMINSTEEFIAKGATKSSISADAYQVRCHNKPTLASAIWLTNQLQLLRAGSKK